MPAISFGYYTIILFNLLYVANIKFEHIRRGTIIQIPIEDYRELIYD